MEEYVYTTTDVNGSLHITPESASRFYSIARWTKFLSVLGFIVVILMAIGLISMHFAFSSMNFYQTPNGAMYHTYFSGGTSWMFTIISILMLVIYAIPLYFLFKFSSKIKQALDTGNTPALSESISYLQKYYSYIGILTIIYLALFVLGIILVAAGYSVYA